MYCDVLEGMRAALEVEFHNLVRNKFKLVFNPNNKNEFLVRYIDFSSLSTLSPLSRKGICSSNASLIIGTRLSTIIDNTSYPNFAVAFVVSLPTIPVLLY